LRDTLAGGVRGLLFSGLPFSGLPFVVACFWFREAGGLRFCPVAALRRDVAGRGRHAVGVALWGVALWGVALWGVALWGVA